MSARAKKQMSESVSQGQGERKFSEFRWLQLGRCTGESALGRSDEAGKVARQKRWKLLFAQLLQVGSVDA